MGLEFSSWIDAFANLPSQIGTPGFWAIIAQIVWIDLLLAGDNALVIALACRNLPPRLRFWGVILGGGLAVLLRLVFTLTAAKLTTLPYVPLIGGLLLIWVAIKLVAPTENGPSESTVPAAKKLWQAVRIIALADLVMSLDNVIALVGVTKDPALIVIGIGLSIPLIFAGAGLMHGLITRFPLLVWAGSLLLVWIAARMILSDVAVQSFLAGRYSHEMIVAIEIGLTAVGAFFLMIFFRLMHTRQK